jgi:hypothetical protein
VWDDDTAIAAALLAAALTAIATERRATQAETAANGERLLHCRPGCQGLEKDSWPSLLTVSRAHVHVDRLVGDGGHDIVAGSGDAGICA